MASYHGDIALGATIDVQFTTTTSAGVPIVLAGSPVISAYIGNSTTELTAGITLTVSLDSVVGLNNVRVVASSGNGYAAGTDVSLIITTGTVDGASVVGYAVGSFSIENRVANVTKIAGAAVSTTTAQLGVNVVQLSADATAADNAEAFFDGTGYAGTGNTIPTVTTATNVTTVNGLAANVITAASIAADAIGASELAADAVTEIQSGLATAAALATVDGIVDDILVDTAVIGALGAGLTAIPWNAAWDAEVESEANDALVAIHLDHLLATDYDPAAKPGTATALLNELVEDDAGVSRYTVNALENAPSGSGASAASIADAVWDELQADHVGAGSFGVTASEIADILVDTAVIGALGAGLTAIPWNAAWDAEVESEVDDALGGGTGTALTAIPWNAAWDAEVESEATDALVAYDPPTNAEIPTVAAIADGVWDEVLTGATHNVATSAGRRLRELAAAVIHSGTATAGAANSITLDAGASGTNEIYDENIVVIVAGTGAGQSRVISEYNGTSKVATTDPVWVTTPDNTSEFVILANALDVVVQHGLAQAGANGSITLATSASTTDDIYNGSTVVIRTSTGAGQSRLITDYDGATRVATVVPNWTVNPGASSVYRVLGIGRSDVQLIEGLDASDQINAAVDTALADYDGPTKAELDAGVVLTNAGIDAILARAITEAYSTDGGTLTVGTALYEIVQVMTERSISGTTMTVKKRDGSTTALTLTLNDATTPTAITRTG